MRSKVARRLRRLADRIDPRPVQRPIVHYGMDPASAARAVERQWLRNVTAGQSGGGVR